MFTLLLDHLKALGSMLWKKSAEGAPHGQQANAGEPLSENYTKAEEEAIRERLKGLGYLE